MPIAVIYITATLLFIGAVPLPYGFYTLLRLIVTGVFIWAAVVTYQRERPALPWVFGVMAVLFNPIIKIYLPKEVWVLVDVAAGLLLLLTRAAVREQEHKAT